MTKQTDLIDEAAQPATLETNREIKRLTWRGVLLQGGFNYERFQNLGFWWTMRPTLDELYPDPKDRAEAYKRHMVYFNTNPWVVGPIAGVTSTMEQQRAKGAEGIGDEAINSVKVSLMAPLAGIGDSLIFGTIRPILAAVCAGLAIDGNILGPILFFLGLVLVQLFMRIWGTSAGYKGGVRFLDKLSPAQIDRVKQAATVVGLAVTGALVATMLKITTPWTYTNGESTISLQEQLDKVLPGLLPIAVTLLVFWLIRRRFSPIWVLVGVTIAGLVGGFFGILA